MVNVNEELVQSHVQQFEHFINGDNASIWSLWIFPSRSLNALPSLDCFLVVFHVQIADPYVLHCKSMCRIVNGFAWLLAGNNESGKFAQLNDIPDNASMPLDIRPAIVSDTSLFFKWHFFMHKCVLQQLVMKIKRYTPSPSWGIIALDALFVKMSSTWFSWTPSKHAFEGHLLQGQNMLSLTMQLFLVLPSNLCQCILRHVGRVIGNRLRVLAAQSQKHR